MAYFIIFDIYIPPKQAEGKFHILIKHFKGTEKWNVLIYNYIWKQLAESYKKKTE